MFPVDLVVRLKDGLVDGVIVVELDEAEAALLAALLVRHSGDRDDVAKLGEIFLDLFVFGIFFDASDEDLLDGQTGLAVSQFVPRCRSLSFNLLSVDGMRSVQLTVVDVLVGGEGHEPETTRSLCIWELHDYNID